MLYEVNCTAMSYGLYPNNAGNRVVYEGSCNAMNSASDDPWFNHLTPEQMERMRAFGDFLLHLGVWLLLVLLCAGFVALVFWLALQVQKYFEKKAGKQ